MTRLRNFWPIAFAVFQGVLWAVAVESRTAHAQYSMIIDVPPQPNIGNFAVVGSNTQVNLSDGGSIGTFFDAGEADGSSTNVQVNVTGGSIARWFDANSGSEVNISGGTIGDEFTAHNGSIVNLSGGVIGDTFRANGGSEVNLLGGTVLDNFNAHHGSTVNFRGGTMGRMSAFSGSTIHIYGGDLRLGGMLIEGLENANDAVPVELPEQGVLSGTLADGTPFALSRDDGELFVTPSITLHAADLPTVGPSTIVASTDPLPLGIRAGQTLIVDNGAVVGDHFNAGWGSAVAVEPGGVVQKNLETTGSTVAVSGSVGDGFGAFAGTVVTVNSGGEIGDNARAVSGSALRVTSGGTIGEFFETFASSVVVSGDGAVGSGLSVIDGSLQVSGTGTVGFSSSASGSVVNLSGAASIGASFDLYDGSVMNVFGGSVGNFFGASGSEINIRGGTVGDDFQVTNSVLNMSGGATGAGFVASGSSTINLTGGLMGEEFDAHSSSTVNLFGTDFLLNGDEIPGLIVGEPFTIVNRNVPLSGLLADGTPFHFDLTSTNQPGMDYFAADATLTLTVVSRLVGDYNDDDAVDAADYTAWRDKLGQTFTLPNEDPTTTPGEVTIDDFHIWRNNYGRVAPGSAGIAAGIVPEPSVLWLLVGGAIWAGLVANRSRWRWPL